MYLPYASGCGFGRAAACTRSSATPTSAWGASWDTDYCWRAALAGIELVFVPDATIHYRLRTSLDGAYKQGKSWATGHVMLQRKYHTLPTRWKVSKHGVGMLKDMLRHLGKLRRVATGADNFESWLWGLGWAVAMAESGIGNWRIATGAESFTPVAVPHARE